MYSCNMHLHPNSKLKSQMMTLQFLTQQFHESEGTFKKPRYPKHCLEDSHVEEEITRDKHFLDQ